MFYSCPAEDAFGDVPALSDAGLFLDGYSAPSVAERFGPRGDEGAVPLDKGNDSAGGAGSSHFWDAYPHSKMNSDA